MCSRFGRLLTGGAVNDIVVDRSVDPKSLNINQFIQTKNRLTEVGQRKLLSIILSASAIRFDLLSKKFVRYLSLKLIRIATKRGPVNIMDDQVG